MTLGLFSALNILSSVVLIGFGLVVLHVRPRNPVHRAFAVFATGFGVGTALSNLIGGDLRPNPLGLDPAFLVVVEILRGLGYAVGGAGAIWLGFAVLGRGRATWRSKFAGATVLVAYTVASGLILQFWTAEGPSALAAGNFLGFGLLAGGALAVACAFGWEARRATTPPTAARDLAFMGAALALYPMLYGGIFLQISFAGAQSGWTVAHAGIFVLTALSVAGFTLAWLAATTRDIIGRAARNVTLLGLAFALLGLGLKAAGCEEPGGCSGAFLTRTLGIAILAYAIVRHQLLDIDLKIKRSVKQGTVVATLAGAYIVTSLGARAFMAPDAAQTMGIVLTGLMLFALVPLQRFGGRVADAAMPGVRDDEAYLDHRKLEVYRTALEDALTSDGDLDPDEEMRLAGLRARLGVTDRDHAVLLHAAGQPGETTVLPIFEPGRTVLSRYRIQAGLGQGGHGTTYKALDTTLGREVVIKVLHGTDTRGLLREARALAAIDHPNVVTIYDVERVGDHVYLVMEHVDGGSLKERLETRPFDEAAFQHLASDLLSGLDAIHDAGLIHRDVKPSNVLLTLDRRAKVADLGIATTTEPSDQTTLGAGSTSARGTIAYMSPEQARGDKLTPRSDLFSAAATLYEASTGRPLFEPRPGESPVELQARVAGWTGFDEELGDPALEAWFARALAPDPADRFPSAGAMRTAPGSPVVSEGRREAV